MSHVIFNEVLKRFEVNVKPLGCVGYINETKTVCWFEPNSDVSDDERLEINNTAVSYDDVEELKLVVADYFEKHIDW